MGSSKKRGGKGPCRRLQKTSSHNMEKLERRPMMASAGGLDRGDGVAIMLFEPICCLIAFSASCYVSRLSRFSFRLYVDPHLLSASIFLSLSLSVRQIKRMRREGR